MKDILINTKILWWFIAYWFARGIRFFFNWEKPITFNEYVNSNKTITDVILA